MRAKIPALHAMRSTVIWLALALCFFLAGSSLSSAPRATKNAPTGLNPGPDIIVGDISSLQQFGSSGTQVGLAGGTNTCNGGNQALNFFAMPNTNHPVLTQNLYRMNGGDAQTDRFEQIGQSWVAHGFFALQNNACNLGCTPGDGAHLGAGCSNPDNASYNAGPINLGSRAWVNPLTGLFSSNANSHTGHTHTGTSHRILVERNDLDPTLNGNATYFAEAQLIAADEYLWCKAHPSECNTDNNVSYRRYHVTGTTTFNFTPVGSTTRMLPAIYAWPGANIVPIEPAPGVDGRAFIASKVTGPTAGFYHYEYAIYNQNLDRGIGYFRVPSGCIGGVSNIGFHAPLNHPGFPNDGTQNDAGYSNTPWMGNQTETDVIWRTETFSENPNANAIRWGTLYNFRFDSGRPPVITDGVVGFFKTDTQLNGHVLAPSECNPTTPTPTPPPTTATHFEVIAPPEVIAFNGFQFTVRALDQLNNIATNYSGMVHFTTTAEHALLPPDDTLVNGVRTFGTDIESLGFQTITATDTANSSITGTSNDIFVHDDQPTPPPTPTPTATPSITPFPEPAEQFAVSAPPKWQIHSPLSFTITALDKFGNPTPVYFGTIHFTSSDSAAELPPDSTLTNGTGTFSATLHTLGTWTITATDTQQTFITGTSNPIIIIGMPPTPTPTPTPTPVCTPLPPATEGFDTITSLVPSGWFMQNNSQPGPGITGWFQGSIAVFSAQSGAASSYIAANFNNGTGNSTLSNWLLTPQGIIGPETTLFFWTRTVDAPTFPDRLQVRMSTHGASTNVGTNATDVGDFTTLLLDINPTYSTTGYPNVWTQYTVHVTGVTTPVAGRFAFRYFVEDGGPNGSNSLYIGIDSLVIAPGCGGVFFFPTPTPTPTPGPATHFEVIAPLDVGAFQPFQFTVRALDQFNNTATNYNGTVHFTATASANLPPDNTLINGFRTFNADFFAVGIQTITATDTVTPSITGTSNEINVHDDQPPTPTPTPTPSITPFPEPAEQFAVSAPPKWQIHSPLSFTITALDRFGNPTPVYFGTIHFTSSDSAAALPPDSTLTNGTGTFSATLHTLGTWTITAADTQQAFITGTSNPIIVIGSPPTPTPTATPTPTPSPATHFEVVAPTETRADKGMKFTVTARDQFNNTVTNYEGTIHFTSSDCCMGLPADSGLSNGTGTFMASPASPVDQTITATDTANPSLTGTSNTIHVLPFDSPTPPPAAQAVNLSTRVLVQSGNNAGIGGFILTGTTPKHLLFRGIGPSLGASGVSNALANPTLDLRDAGGSQILANDNWRDTQESEITATGIAPTNDLEAAIVTTLEPASYTVILRGAGSTEGVGLVEIYDLDQSRSAKLANLSTRAFVSTGNDVVIAGFILDGDTDRVVGRGIGPSLTTGGVAEALADPTLELRDSNGALHNSNNDWQDDAAQAAQLTAVGLAPSNNLESGMMSTLSPGLYTVILAGRNGGTGIGLVEIYDLGQ